MLGSDSDLADPILLAPRPPTADRAPEYRDTLDRFLDGICRTVGALAGCLIPHDDRAMGAIIRPCGFTARNDEARAALRVLLRVEVELSRRGYGWVRDSGAPDYCGLAVETPMQHGAGHLLLLFARDHLEEDEVIVQVLALAPGLGAMAGAMHEVTVDLALAERRHRALAAALRQSECGTILVRADHSVLFANPAAQTILDAADGMELRRNLLRPERYQDVVRFQAALDAVIAPPLHAKPGRSRSLMRLLERSGAQRPLIAVIAPAGCASGDDADGVDQGEAAAIVYLMRHECRGAQGLEAICHLHGLSPVETQLVSHLVSGLPLGETAAQMRIKPDTARTYLKQVFAKTDTHRQSDLLQLMLRYQRAVRGDFLFESA